MSRFSKPPLSIQQQFELLKSRGLTITDEIIACHFLENISYYRLGGYWFHLQKDAVKHEFKEGATFEQAIHCYNFDRELRLLLFDAIERIEVGFRTRLIYQLSHTYQSWWFEDRTLFKNAAQHEEVLKEIYKDLRRTEEQFIKDHKRKYETPQTPPSWKTLEICSLGSLSKLYGLLISSTVKQEIAKSLKLPNSEYLESWMSALVVLRNLCAHHSRIYNRIFSFPPKTLKTSEWPWIKPAPNHWQSQTSYYQISFTLFLLNAVSPGHSFHEKFFFLLLKYPEISHKEMGFPIEWRKETLWNV